MLELSEGGQDGAVAGSSAFPTLHVDFSDRPAYSSRMPQQPDQPATSPAEVETLIIDMLARLKEKTPAEVRRALRQRGDSMPCDSLDSVEILLELEDRFGITLPDDQETADALRSVSALAQHVCERVGQAGAMA